MADPEPGEVEFPGGLGVWMRRRLPNGRVIDVFPIMFGKWRIGLWDKPLNGHQPQTYENVF